MGEWSEYFEDFPEENPANQKNRDSPDLGKMSEFFPQWHESQLTKAERAEVKAKIDLLNAAAAKEAEDRANFIKEAKTSPLFLTDTCPQCYLKEMNIYKINDNFYFSECQECGVSGSGTNHKTILEDIGDAIWKQPE